MIKLSTRKWATIKRTAQIVQPSVAKRVKLIEQIMQLQEELAEVDASIAEWDGAVRRMTGYSSTDLIVRTVEPTGKVDAKGVPTKVTKWLPSPLVTFNEEENVYEIPENQPTCACINELVENYEELNTPYVESEMIEEE